MKNLLSSGCTALIMSAALIGCAAHKGAPATIPDPGSSDDIILDFMRLGSPFGSHMVLQRDVPVPIWGTDTPGQIIAVVEGTRSWTTRTGSDGKWNVDIGPFAVGGPYRIVVSGTGRTTLDDVLAGEVWLASGQSNMEWALERSDNGKSDAAQAANSSIRLLAIPRTGSAEPADFVANTGWKVCSPESAAPFSAVAYHFGRELQETLDVPVGLVMASWGGSNMESWTRADAMAGDPVLSWTVEERRQWSASAVDHASAAAEYRRALADWEANPRPNRHIADPGDGGAPQGWTQPAFDDSAWDTVSVPEQMNLKLGNFDGVYCFRKAVDVPGAWAGKALVLKLGAIDDEDVTLFNGTEVGRMGASTPNVATAPRTYTVPAVLARAGTNVIAVRVFDKALGGGIYGPAAEMTLAPADGSGAPIKLSGEWRLAFAHKERGSPQAPFKPERAVPGMLYNGMIHPLAPFRFRGAIWYQGEANTGRAAQYRHLSETMITDWRRQFGNPDLWFLFVQLAGFDTKQPGWIEVMGAQRRTLDVPRTGMAVAADVGNATDIHPTDKRTVGHRLALAARALAYGENIVHSGPTVRSAMARGNDVVLAFDHAGGGLVPKGADAGGRVGGFEIAGSDGVFRDASAMIEGDTIVLVNSGGPAPATVRYAWRNFPACDLYNKDGLPAPPFRVAVTGGR